MTLSTFQKQAQELEDRSRILDRIVAAAKTPGGHISEAGKQLIPILRQAGLKKSEIAPILDVTQSALTKYD
jgi:uncharacterized membrane protein YebE (DUF533 family)